MRFNPVYLNDLRLNVRSIKFATMIFAYDLCLGLTIILFLYAGMHDQNGMLVFNYANCEQLLAIIAGVELGVVFFVVPALTSGTIAGECEKQTLDLLLASKLKPFHIICGKISYSITTVIVLIISSFPIITVVSNTGSLSIKMQWQLLLLLLVTAVYVSSIGIYFSTVKKRTISAIVWTYAIILVITVGTIIIYNLSRFVMEDMKLLHADSISANVVYYLFLFNPIATYVYIISDANQSIMTAWIPKNMQAYWVELSIFVQLAVSIGLIALSSLKLNPLSKEHIIDYIKKRKTS